MKTTRFRTIENDITPLQTDFAGIALILAELRQMYKDNICSKAILDECVKSLFTTKMIIANK